MFYHHHNPKTASRLFEKCSRLAGISVVNNFKYETAYSPIFVTLIQGIAKQMSVRNTLSSFMRWFKFKLYQLTN